MVDPAIADPNAETLPSDPASGGAAETRDALIGCTLGHFRVDARLGRGGMGAVYRAWDASLEREVALKVLLGASDASRDRFLREARVQAKLRHPHVVPIHFVGQSEETSFLVMDVVDGESLSDLLAREGTLTESRALDVADAICAALAAGSDANLVHRDVKPSNILIDRQGRIMLADFGLAKVVNVSHAIEEPVRDVSLREAPADGAPNESGALTRAGAILGTPAYLAPEQALGERVDFRADMYSLGVTLYEALTGQPPFTGGNASALLRQHVHETPIAPRILAPALRPVVDALVVRLLDKNPSARFASYTDLRAAIAAARAKPIVPATFFVRAVALAVDLVVVGAYAGVLTFITRSGTVGWLAAALSFGALERAWSTPGKKLMHLRVVDHHGDAPSWGRLLVRSTLRLLGPIVLAADSDVLGTKGLAPHAAADAIVGAAAFLAWLVALSFGLRGTPLHDRIVRTREVFD